MYRYYMNVDVTPPLAVNTEEFTKYFKSFHGDDPIPATCPQCKRAFIRTRNYYGSKFGRGNARRSAYCSRTCAAEAMCTSIIVQCTECSTDVRKLPSQLKDGRPFCSSRCAAIHTNKHHITAACRARQAEKVSALARARMESLPKSTKVDYGTCLGCGRYFAYKRCKSKRAYCGDGCRKTLLSTLAKNRGLGGNFSNRAWGWYESPFAGTVWLESSYEHKLAVDLDAGGIDWCRPPPIPYEVDGTNHKYFPDFYIKSLDLYLDPKNDFLIPKDMPKIAAVEIQNSVRILILRKDELSFRHILEKLGAGSGICTREVISDATLQV